jgi:DNA integrity scanning protein DisA with diadenylate cyclase activity
MNNAKVTVPQSVATAIAHFVNLADSKHEAFTDILRLGYETEQSEIILRHFDGDYDVLMEVLICGYEVEKSPEEKVREFYKNLTEEIRSNPHNYVAQNKYQFAAFVVKATLNRLGIKIEGVNA